MYRVLNVRFLRLLAWLQPPPPPFVCHTVRTFRRPPCPPLPSRSSSILSNHRKFCTFAPSLPFPIPSSLSLHKPPTPSPVIVSSQDHRSNTYVHSAAQLVIVRSVPPPPYLLITRRMFCRLVPSPPPPPHPFGHSHIMFPAYYVRIPSYLCRR